jgi:hypothetical protein
VATALNETLAALNKAGAQAVLVMDVPEPGYDVPVVLARSKLSGVSINVNPPRAAVDERQKLARQVLTDAARKWSLQVIDPTQEFCDADFCRAEQNGISLYMDADHITTSTALTISHLFDRSFSTIARYGAL